MCFEKEKNAMCRICIQVFSLNMVYLDPDPVRENIYLIKKIIPLFYLDLC
jgi:hypothetical protein